MNDNPKNKRFLISGEANYRVKGSLMPPITVVVHELRETGLIFVTIDNLAQGIELELEIRVSENSDPISAVGKVIHQGNSTSKFLLDTEIEFSYISDKDKSRLTNYINTTAENIKANRLHVRCPMVTEVKFSLINNPERELSGISADIGIKGLKLFVREEIDLNTEINIIFDLPRGRGTIEAQGKIVWKGQKSKNGNTLGLEFIDISNINEKRILRYINFTIPK
ncbi:MAG: PilZ domain-containing protein [Candidatus Omnitrophota bacterium]